MNVVNQYGEKRNGFAEVAALAGIVTDFYTRSSGESVPSLHFLIGTGPNM